MHACSEGKRKEKMVCLVLHGRKNESQRFDGRERKKPEHGKERKKKRRKEKKERKKRETRTTSIFPSGMVESSILTRLHDLVFYCPGMLEQKGRVETL